MTDKVYRLGCDIGGTFTDFVLLNDQTGEILTSVSPPPEIPRMPLSTESRRWR